MNEGQPPGKIVRYRSPERPKDVADHIILDAEHFKGNIAAPKGNDMINDTANVIPFMNGSLLPCVTNVNVLSPEIELLRKNDNDDDFFHITCHVDQSLCTKIERGEYVDLEHLLSKELSSKPLNEDKRIELVSRGGATFFAPVQECDARLYA